MKNIIVNGVENPFYKATEDGRIFNAEGHEMTLHKMANGYMRVRLHRGLERNLYLVHRIIAETFLEKSEGLNVVHHKDAVRDNNRVSNLEWCDNSHNQKQRFKTHKGTKRKPVKQLDLSTGEVLKVWDSPIDAETALGIPKQNICHVCKGRRKSAGGYGWQHIN